MKQANNLYQSIYKAAIILGLVAFISAIILSSTHSFTTKFIAENERQFLLQKLNKILPKNYYDNDLSKDTKTIPADELLGTDTSHIAYIAKKNNQIITIFLHPVASGYNGEIHLLVAINKDNSLAGVRIVKHHETVGLADKIEDTKSNWILNFAGKTLQNHWKVKKDGGEFDQFTGATITPRAIVKAIKNTLIYTQKHPELFNL